MHLALGATESMRNQMNVPGLLVKPANKADVYSFKFPHESIIEKSMDVPGSRFIGEAGKKADVYSFEVPYE